MKPVITSGEEFKRYMNDDSVWPQGQFFEEEKILVNGRPEDDIDVDKLLGSDIIEIHGGAIMDDLDGWKATLMSHFKKWKKAQGFQHFVVEMPIDKVGSIISAITERGGIVK